MSKIIKISFSENIRTIYDRGKFHSKLLKGDFSGDIEKGSFNFETFGGRYKGSYTVKKNIIEFILISKPFLVPTIVIEKFLRSNIK